MAIDSTQPRERGRRGRYLIPRDLQGRQEIVAGCYVALLIVHVVALQVAAVLGLLLFGVIRAGRLGRTWLLVPLLAGVVWVLALDPVFAVAQHFAAARQILSYASQALFHPTQPHDLGQVLGGWQAWIPQQLPLALVIGSAEAMIAAWLAWLHTDEWRRPPTRPGPLLLVRRFLTGHGLRSGRLITRAGVRLGVDEATGRGVELSWREIGGHVLCVGGADTGKTATCFQVAYAAVRLRKPLVVLDLAGDRALVDRLRAACGSTGTPLSVFTTGGPGYYEPWSRGDPAARTDLVTGLLDWHGVADQHRRTCARYLYDTFTVLDAAPGDGETPVLDDLVRLVDPRVLQARAETIPAYHADRDALLERVRVSTSLASADSQVVEALGGQLRELQMSTAARWLRPAPPGAQEIDLEAVVRERGVAVFSIDVSARGRGAGRIARLVAQDLAALAAKMIRMDVDADGLVWVDELAPIGAETVDPLLARGGEAGLPVIVTSRHLAAGSADGLLSRLVDQVGSYIVHRVSDPRSAAAIARLVGDGPAVRERKEDEHEEPDGGLSLTRELRRLDDCRFLLVVKTPRFRVVRRARTIPAVVPAQKGGADAQRRDADARS
ncbi:MAG: hypothetical protein ACRDN9_09655 [Streptosporangiaceae bacterium]